MNGERLYSALLFLYPSSFRRDFGPEMIDAFRHLRTHRRGGKAALVCFLAVDILRSAGTAHALEWRAAARPFVVEWTAACACGVAVASLLANALTWGFSYFYHPYLEGLSVPPSAYGAILGAGLGLAQAVVLRRPLRLGAAWVAATSVAAALGFQVAANLEAPGPVGYGLALGLSVGTLQWTMLRTRVARPAHWIATSACALGVAALACTAAIRSMAVGINPLAGGAPLTRSAYTTYQTHAADLASVTAMMMAGLVIAALTVRPLGFTHAQQEHS